MHQVQRHVQPFIFGAMAFSLCAGIHLTHDVKAGSSSAKTRSYYIAAEDLLWDYAPSYPNNPMTGKAFTNARAVFVEDNGVSRIGRKYWKALYREYTDASFATPKASAPEWEHLGTLGPVIRASVGDTVLVVFKNNTADKVLSVHPRGVFYTKDSEGAPYNDGTAGNSKTDDAVPPGGIHAYRWELPQRAGPA